MYTSLGRIHSSIGLMINQIPGTYPEHLTHAGEYLADMLESQEKPVLRPYIFFQLIEKMYAEASGKRLYLRHQTPDKDDYARLRRNLTKAGYIGTDRDYGSRVIRVLSVSDLPAEDIVSIVDPTCHVSHLSAMQRWGLTDRRPDALILTRPTPDQMKQKLAEIMANDLGPGASTPFPLKGISHPPRVRRRRIDLHESSVVGASIVSRGSSVRISTIGQTFLDMLQIPDLCGGMAHVLDVWKDHALTYLPEIIEVTDTAKSPIAKIRAGHILEERLGVKNDRINAWKAFAQRGSSRKLDPHREFIERHSETWMISINV